MSKYYNEVTETPKFSKIISHVVVLFIGLVLVFGSWTTINSGERGVVLRFGKINKVLEQGLHFKAPWIDSVKTVDVKTQKIEVQASAASKDMQIVTTQLAVQFNVDPENVDVVYETLKNKYRARIIDPAIQNAIKASTAKFTAEELITKRSEVVSMTFDILQTRLLGNNIIVSNVDIIDFDFSPKFNQAIEAKVEAEQKAFEQEMITKQEVEIKKQDILKAEAMSEKTRLEVEALKMGSDLIEKIRAEAQLEAARRWNGQLPQTMIPGGALPFIDVLSSSK